MLLAGYFGAFFLLWFLKWEIQTRESWIEETHLNKRYLRRPERTLIFSLKYKYRVSSNNSRPFNRLPWIIAPLCRKCLKLPPPSNNPPPPPTTTTPLGYPQGLPIAVNLEDEAKKESDPAQLISDDSSSNVDDIDIEN